MNKIRSINTKLKSAITTCFFLITIITSAQRLDSVRQVIKDMGYDLPRLSPLPYDQDEKTPAILSLNGTWKFTTDSKNSRPFQNIEVPGEWVMQGFNVQSGNYAEYMRSFNIPSDWNGRRIKLRCDAVFSKCEIFINGKKAGGHLGGFTAFETDISAFLQPKGENIISIKVLSESIADKLSSASKYAVHPLGGITRKIYLFALPELNCSMFHVSTAFDHDYLNALLTAEIELTNESTKDAITELSFELRRDGDQSILLKKQLRIDEPLIANSSIIKNFSFDVAHPDKWDPEHPNLYSLKLILISRGKAIETIYRSFGFKQTEVRDNQVFVNNMPIKLRGVCRHEVMPLRGRSLTASQWEDDVRIFREANINYIRTSHYPPAPELIEACDRLGMFVEVEGPFCWAEHTRVHENIHFLALIQPELEMINAFRSNPSVLMWSLANESGKYMEYFSQSAALIKAIDPTRPRIYSDNVPSDDMEALEIGNDHYPGPTGPEIYRNADRPIIFDEYCHLNAYNRFELVTDPGIRDVWGIGFESMWNNMYYSKGVLGGSLWAGIDDSFVLPDGRTVGYGTWGPVDGWRRPKPEYWHVKKVYSPVKITKLTNEDPTPGKIKFSIENRMLFSDLSECKFNWKAGLQTGSFKARAKPGETDTVNVDISQTEKVYLEVADPKAILIDQYEFSVIPPKTHPKVFSGIMTTKTIEGSEIQIQSGSVKMIIDKKTQALKEIQTDGKTMIMGDASVMVLPLNGKGNGTQMTGENIKFEPFTASCKNRIVQKIEQISDSDGSGLRIFDKSDITKGYTDYMLSDGELKISYKYEIRININPRQVGLVFSIPGRFQELEWERIGQWNYYPEDHIGRLQGKAFSKNENIISGPAGPVKKPDQAWIFDQNELGTNDFRSTKMNITRAALVNENEKVIVDSDGSQSIRCWMEKNSINMLVASYSNMGAEGFYRSHAELIDRPLKTGDFITGTIKVSFLNKEEKK